MRLDNIVVWTGIPFNFHRPHISLNQAVPGCAWTCLVTGRAARGPGGLGQAWPAGHCLVGLGRWPSQRAQARPGHSFSVLGPCWAWAACPDLHPYMGIKLIFVTHANWKYNKLLLELNLILAINNNVCAEGLKKFKKEKPQHMDLLSQWVVVVGQGLYTLRSGEEVLCSTLNFVGQVP